jgi:hypothetical protein
VVSSHFAGVPLDVIKWHELPLLSLQKVMEMALALAVLWYLVVEVRELHAKVKEAECDIKKYPAREQKRKQQQEEEEEEGEEEEEEWGGGGALATSSDRDDDDDRGTVCCIPSTSQGSAWKRAQPLLSGLYQYASGSWNFVDIITMLLLVVWKGLMFVGRQRLQALEFEPTTHGYVDFQYSLQPVLAARDVGSIGLLIAWLKVPTCLPCV